MFPSELLKFLLWLLGIVKDWHGLLETVKDCWGLMGTDKDCLVPSNWDFWDQMEGCGLICTVEDWREQLRLLWTDGADSQGLLGLLRKDEDWWKLMGIVRNWWGLTGTVEYWCGVIGRNMGWWGPKRTVGFLPTGADEDWQGLVGYIQQGLLGTDTNCWGLLRTDGERRELLKTDMDCCGVTDFKDCWGLMVSDSSWLLETDVFLTVGTERTDG